MMKWAKIRIYSSLTKGDYIIDILPVIVSKDKKTVTCEIKGKNPRWDLEYFPRTHLYDSEKECTEHDEYLSCVI